MNAEDLLRFLPSALDFIQRPPDEIVLSPSDKRKYDEYFRAMCMIEEKNDTERIMGLKIWTSEWVADGEPLFVWRERNGRMGRLERVNFCV